MARQLPLTVSNSELNSFKWCKRNWYVSWYLLKRRRREHRTPVSAATLGTKVHVALATYYADGTNPLETLTRVYAEDLAYWREEAEDALTVELLQKEQSLAQAMVEGYVQWVEETGADEDYTVTDVEHRMEVALPDFSPDGEEFEFPGVKLTGQLDARLVRKVDHARLFMDHKTVQSLDGKGLVRNRQMKFYHLLERLDALERTGSFNPPEPTDGALYNMLRKVKRTPKANPPFYGRIEVKHNGLEIENFLTNVMSEIEEMISTILMLDSGVSHQKATPPTPNGECEWKCEHVAICNLMDDGSNWKWAIEEEYEDRTPHDYYDEKKGPA